MKVVAISDIHGYLPKSLPTAEALLIAGDVLPDLRPLHVQAEWARYELLAWLKTQQTKGYRYIILTWGNHDFVDAWGEPVSEYLSKMLNEGPLGPVSCKVYIAGSPQIIKLSSKIFYVNPYCLQLPGWAYQTNEECLKDMYRDIPIGVDCIISHGPPLDYCDKLAKIEGFHAGSKALKDAIRQSRPTAVVCGHIHEAFGKHTLYHAGVTEPTTIYNVSQLDLEYKYHDRPVEFEI